MSEAAVSPPRQDPARLSLLLREFHELEQDWELCKNKHGHPPKQPSPAPEHASKQHAQPRSSPGGAQACSTPTQTPAQRSAVTQQASGVHAAKQQQQQQQQQQLHSDQRRHSDGAKQAPITKQPSGKFKQPSVGAPHTSSGTPTASPAKPAASASCPAPAESAAQEPAPEQALKKAAKKKKKWVPPPWNNEIVGGWQGGQPTDAQTTPKAPSRPSSGRAQSASPAQPSSRASPKLQRRPSGHSAERGADDAAAALEPIARQQQQQQPAAELLTRPPPPPPQQQQPATVSNPQPEPMPAMKASTSQPQPIRQRRKWVSTSPDALGSEPSEAFSARAEASDLGHGGQLPDRSASPGPDAGQLVGAHCAAAAEDEAHPAAAFESSSGYAAAPPSPPWSDLVRQGSVTLGAIEEDSLPSHSSRGDVASAASQGTVAAETTPQRTSHAGSHDVNAAEAEDLPAPLMYSDGPSDARNKLDRQPANSHTQAPQPPVQQQQQHQQQQHQQQQGAAAAPSVTASPGKPSSSSRQGHSAPPRRAPWQAPEVPEPSRCLNTSLSSPGRQQSSQQQQEPASQRLGRPMADPSPLAQPPAYDALPALPLQLPVHAAQLQPIHHVPHQPWPAPSALQVPAWHASPSIHAPPAPMAGPHSWLNPPAHSRWDGPGSSRLPQWGRHEGAGYNPHPVPALPPAPLPAHAHPNPYAPSPMPRGMPGEDAAARGMGAAANGPLPDYLRMSASKLTTGWAMPHAAQRQGALSAFADIYSHRRRATQPPMPPLPPVHPAQPSFGMAPHPHQGPAFGLAPQMPYGQPYPGSQQQPATQGYQGYQGGAFPAATQAGYMQPPHMAAVPQPQGGAYGTYGQAYQRHAAGEYGGATGMSGHGQGQGGAEEAGPSSAVAAKPGPARHGGGFEGMSLADVLATAPKKAPPPFMQKKGEQQQPTAVA